MKRRSCGEICLVEEDVSVERRGNRFGLLFSVIITIELGSGIAVGSSRTGQGL